MAKEGHDRPARYVLWQLVGSPGRIRGRTMTAHGLWQLEAFAQRTVKTSQTSRRGSACGQSESHYCVLVMLVCLDMHKSSTGI